MLDAIDQSEATAPDDALQLDSPPRLPIEVGNFHIADRNASEISDTEILLSILAEMRQMRFRIDGMATALSQFQLPFGMGKNKRVITPEDLRR